MYKGILFVSTVLILSACQDFDEQVIHAPIYKQCIGLVEPLMTKASSLHGTKASLTLFDSQYGPYNGAIGFVSIAGPKTDLFLNSLQSLCYPASGEKFENSLSGAQQVLSRVERFEEDGRDFYVRGEKGRISIYYNDTPQHIVDSILENH